MIWEWIRFVLVALLLVIALFSFASAALGVWRFGFIMNRIHSAGIGDTLGLSALAAALMLYSGLSMQTLEILLIVVFMWFTSPVSSHFLCQIEYYTNPELYRHTGRREEEEPSGEPEDPEEKR